MKRNIILLLIFLFVFHSKTKSQNDIRTIDVNKIEHPFFKDILTAYYGKTSLPFFQDKRKTVKYMQKNRPYTRYAYIGNNVDPDLPLYINPDKRDKEKNEKENAIIALFYETNGDYMIAILWTISNDHNAVKYLITTFDLHGEAIDWLTFYEKHGSIQTVQGEVSKDLTVDIYTLDFPNNNFIVTSDHKVVKDLVGQRIDRRYRITPEGKFELLIETRYKPQGYTEEMLQSEKSIFEGNEIKLLN